MKKIFIKIYYKNKFEVFFLSLLVFFSSVLAIIIPYLNGKFIDNLVRLKNVNQILRIVLYIIVLGVLKIIFTYLYQTISSKLIVKSIYDFRIELLNHFRRIPILKYKKFDSVYLNERTRKDISEVINAIVNNYTNVFLKAVTFLVCIIIVGYLNVYALLCIVIITPIYIFVYNYYKKHIYDLNLSVKENENIFFKVYNEQLYLMEEIKIDSKYQSHDMYVDKKFTNYFGSFAKYINLSAKFNSVESIVSIIFQATLFIFGAISILNNEMSIGDLTIINSYFGIIIGVVNYYVSFGKLYQESKSSFDRLQKLSDIKEENNGSLRLEDIVNIEATLNFGYQKDNKILKNKNLNFKLGQIYGIIGINGSGKSTITKLLIGIYPSDENSEILYNGVKRQNVDMEYLRRKRIAFVSQNPKMTNKKICELFQEIDENISLEKISYYLNLLNDKNAFDSTKIVKDFWEKFYYELSEGEKQIIVIIRALCKEPNLLILDEPTSSLDFSKKDLLNRILEDIKNKLIIIIVSHDKDFLKVCNKIIEIS